MSVFGRAVDELLGINVAQAVLLLFGPGLTVPPQKALEPEVYCRSRMYEHYETVVSVSFFIVLYIYALTVLSGYVKTRLPDAADAGLQTLAPKRRRVLRSFAAVGWLFNLGASVLAVATYAFILQAKLGLFECLPAATRACMIVTYVIVGCVLAVVYADNGWRIIRAA